VAVSPGTRVAAQPGTVTPRLGPGEYCLDAHGLVHSDGTITLRGRVRTPGWSGRLRRGVWEEDDPKVGR
jgi:hypothetical protein